MISIVNLVFSSITNVGVDGLNDRVMDDLTCYLLLVNLILAWINIL